MTGSSSATATIEQVAKVVDRASSDAAFRQQLLGDPAGTLRGAGVEVGSGVEVRVLENSSSLVNLVLPPRPDGVADADLQQVGDTKSGGDSAASNLAALGALVIGIWADSSLKSRLLQDPAAVLAERGISLPGNPKVQVVEATADVSYLVVPPAITGGAE